MEDNYEQTIKTIVDASCAIKNIYQGLATLEINNKKNTQEYYNLLKKISIMQEIEDIYYVKIENKLDSFYQFIYGYCTVYKEEIDEIVKDRISNYLIHRTETSNDEYSCEFFQKYFQKQLKKIQVRDKNLNIKKLFLIEDYILESIFNTYLYLLELKSKRYPELIEEKYNAYFMYKYKENEFIKDNFNARSIYYLDSKTMAKLFNIKESTYQLYLNSVIHREFYSELEKLIDNSHEYNYIKQLNEEYYLRALFTISESETIDKLNEIFHETIDNYENTNTNNDISNATDIITNAFRQYKKDRKKVKILSLGKREN